MVKIILLISSGLPVYADFFESGPECFQLIIARVFAAIKLWQFQECSVQIWMGMM